MAAKEFPEWAKILYRGIRTAIGAGIGQIIVLQPDWTKPEEAGKTLLIAFLAGFSTSFGMWLRDILDEHFDQDPKSLVQRAMPF